MEALISVIIPVYNSEAYLEECVESVLKQSYPRFEVLLVDDGSQDNSIALCERLCAEDKRLRLLRQGHGGVSAARNRAMEAANGEYLFFLDSDDAIHPKLLETLLGLAVSTGAAVVQANSIRMDSGQLYRRLHGSENDPKGKSFYCLNSQQALERFIFGGKAEGAFCTVRGQLVLRNAAQPLRFDEGMSHGEDTKFLYQLLIGGVQAAFLQKDWYYYRIHTSNASRICSAAAYQSMYACEKYICEQERGSGRKSHAAWRERLIVDRILEWYRLSRKIHSREAKRYLEKLADAERGSEGFALLSRRDRIKLLLAFYCYPLYLPLHTYLSWRWRRMEKRQGKNG